ncbi:PilZ domain-containing protein [Massilia horti]|uniref:PilZ domain-containing protein n=1 Tax=Massilia horti TaxID=2562153 RepID=A0A4Y9SZB1_9BURK|nr:PilZ domain-containing protein [Massilia horti]TFW31804.1 PilZ domain-containing protein [Massilia horti]
MIPSALTIIRKGVPTLADALDQIAPDSSPHEMCDPFDIGEALEMLAQSGDAVTVYPSRMNKNRLMARIHQVDPEQPHFVIDFADGTPPPGVVTLVAALGGNAKLQFDLLQDWQSLPGHPNLVPATFPASCLVLNRRASPRLESPVGVNFVASFTLQGQAYELPLYDFSTGGVGMRATPEQAIGLRVGKKLERVQLELGPALVIIADLEIRLLRPFRTFLLGDQVQIGCAFRNISMQIRQNLESLVSVTGERRRGG